MAQPRVIIMICFQWRVASRRYHTIPVISPPIAPNKANSMDVSGDAEDSRAEGITDDMADHPSNSDDQDLLPADGSFSSAAGLIQ